MGVRRTVQDSPDRTDEPGRGSNSGRQGKRRDCSTIDLICDAVGLTASGFCHAGSHVCHRQKSVERISGPLPDRRSLP